MKTGYIFASAALFLLFFTPSTFAQIGFKAGAGVSDIAFLKDGQVPYLSYEINVLEHRIPMTSFQGGVFATLKLGKRFDFQPELRADIIAHLEVSTTPV